MTSLSPNEPLEPVHIHGVTDTSTHLCLPVERAQEVCDLGWGEVHPFGDFGTEIMVYGPRNQDELTVILSIIQESLNFARALN
jgi:phospholipase/carboxylesterase